MHTLSLIALPFIILTALSSSVLAAHENLSLEAFIEQVKSQNQAVKGALTTVEGANLKEDEKNISTSWIGFATYSYTKDAKPPTLPFFNFDFQNSGVFAVGVSKQTSFGLNTKLSYNVLNLAYQNFLSAGSLIPLQIQNYNNGLSLDLSQSLWSNAWGRGTRATVALQDSQNHAILYQNRFGVRMALLDAEGSYWKLATMRQAVRLTRQNLERSHKIYDWSARRAKLQLADRSDELQALANLNARKLDLQRAIDDEKAASRNFNTLRGIQENDVKDELITLTPNAVLEMKASPRALMRDDVRAAFHQSQAAHAAAQTAIEKETPLLDIFGTFGMNSRDAALTTALNKSLSLDKPTGTIGVRFQSSLDFKTLGNSRAGYKKDQAAAEFNYERKVFEQDRAWSDLNERLDEARQRLLLTRELEKIQKEKLERERSRLEAGRSTAFQVLAFETDFAVSELSTLQTQSEVLGILTQMKLFGESL